MVALYTRENPLPRDFQRNRIQRFGTGLFLIHGYRDSLEDGPPDVLPSAPLSTTEIRKLSTSSALASIPAKLYVDFGCQLETRQRFSGSYCLCGALLPMIEDFAACVESPCGTQNLKRRKHLTQTPNV